jgi:hypothetical protein
VELACDVQLKEDVHGFEGHFATVLGSHVYLLI